MHNKTNRLVAALATIAATLTPVVSRIKRAKLATITATGHVVEGVTTYRSVCPKGAGFGPASHTFEQQYQVGSRSFKRRQHRFISALKYHPFGRNFK